MTIYNKAKEYNIYGYILKEYAQNELENCFLAIKSGNCYYSEFIQATLIKDREKDLSELSQLTFSERKIITLIAEQKTSKQIAEMLFLSIKTVEGHRSNIIEKLGLPKEKNTLLVWAIQNVNVP